MLPSCLLHVCLRVLCAIYAASIARGETGTESAAECSREQVDATFGELFILLRKQLSSSAFLYQASSC